MSRAGVVVGDTVLYSQPTSERLVNGTSIHPAIVTRGFADGVLNLAVFFDSGMPEPRLNVQHHEDAPAFSGYWVERS